MTTPEQQNDIFKAALDGLNPEQRTAVDRTEGPVLVLAGPGTGKTQVLATRIGNILLTTDARPQNILCLTFTDAGVQAMRQRLVTLIGPTAHRVPIVTYHSFCNRVIQENAAVFGHYHLETLTEVEQIELLRDLLGQLPPEHPIHQGHKSPYHYERQLRNLFGLMKRERWKPGQIQRSTKQWLQQIPENEAFIYKRNSPYGKKGALKKEKVQEETERMALLDAAADLYPTYLRALEKAGRYEYEDMILWTIEAFDKHPELLRNYQERYQYVLVDEFQDTNGAQHTLLQQLISYWDTPNIFIVGDDDQSIYEFQGARLQNLLEFQQKHQKNLHTVVLGRNYRSLQPILDAAHHLIEENQLRAAAKMQPPVEKTLTAQRTDAEFFRLEQVCYTTPLAEDTDIVAQIADLIAAGTPADTIAVICQQHQQYKRLMDLLGKLGLPYQTRRPQNLLDLPLVRHIRDVLLYLHDEATQPFSGEHRLFGILHAPFFQIEAVDLAKFALMLQKDDGRTWREALLDSPWPAARALAELPAMVLDGTPLSSLTEALFTRLGVLNHALRHPDKAWLLQIMGTWAQFVEAGEQRDAQFGLPDLLRTLDNMADNKLELPLLQQIQTGAGVHLLTGHGAKGLEFEYVFVPHCTADNWEPGNRGQHARHFYYPPTLVPSGEEDAMEARRRLFYVALTRAKTQLQVSYSRLNEKGKPQQAARFLDETRLPTRNITPDVAQVLAQQAILLGESERPTVTLPDSAVFERFLANFSLSVRSLNKYLRCPLAFYYEDVLRVPSASSGAALYGQAVHMALQLYFQEMMAHEQREFPPAARLADLFEREMLRRQRFFPKQNFVQQRAFGKETMLRYATEQMPYWRKRARVEVPIRQVELEGAMLYGVLDKIEFLDGGILRVVDYKTGKFNKNKIAPPSETQTHGGEYYRQLLFYKVLVTHSPIFTEMAGSGVISWIESDKKGNFRYDELFFTAQEAQWMQDLIAQVWLSIHALQFDTGCGLPDCNWCTMHRERSFFEIPEAAEVELDD